jgi:hypothetical protein
MSDTNVIEIENISKDEVLLLCLKASKKYFHKYGDYRIFPINNHDDYFEEIFRNEIKEPCGTKIKDDLFFIALRGIFEWYRMSYKKQYDGTFPPSKAKQKFSRKYRTAQNTIKELFKKHYQPCNEYELEKLKDTEELIETVISQLEVTEGMLRKRANIETTSYLKQLGYPKTSIKKILTSFRTLL